MAALGPGALPGAPPVTVHLNYANYFNDAGNDPFEGNYAAYMTAFALEPYVGKSLEEILRLQCLDRRWRDRNLEIELSRSAVGTSTEKYIERKIGGTGNRRL